MDMFFSFMRRPTRLVSFKILSVQLRAQFSYKYHACSVLKRVLQASYLLFRNLFRGKFQDAILETIVHHVAEKIHVLFGLQQKNNYAAPVLFLQHQLVTMYLFFFDQLHHCRTVSLGQLGKVHFFVVPTAIDAVDLYPSNLSPRVLATSHNRH